MWNQNVAYNGYHGQRDYRQPSYIPGKWMNWMNLLVKETNVDADSSTVSSSEPRSSKRRGNSRGRRTCVTKTLVGIVFALLLLGISFVPLILYFVEKDEYKYYKAEASITFQGTYNESLGDLSTQISINFQQDFCQVMEQTQDRKFKETYNGCLVTQITNGSIIVEFTMYYYTKMTVQSDDVKSEIITYLKTNFTTTFSSKFNLTVDFSSLYVSLVQTGRNGYNSGTSDSRFITAWLTSTKGTASTFETTISSNADNATITDEVTTTLTESTVTIHPAVTTTVPSETTTETPASTTAGSSETTTDTQASTTTAPSETTTTDTLTTTITDPHETTTIDTLASTTTIAPGTITTDTSTTTITVAPETTTDVTPTATTTVHHETTTTDTRATTTTGPHETTTTDTQALTVAPETTTTETTSTTTTVAPETTTTETTSTTTTVAPETTTTETTSTTTTVLPETTIIVTPTTITTVPPQTITTNTPTTTTIFSQDNTTTTSTTNSPTSSTKVLTDTNTTNLPTTTETFTDATSFITTSSDNDTMLPLPSEPFADVVMKNSIGEIGKQAYIPCSINITGGEWVMIYLYQTYNESIDPRIATLSKNETITYLNRDPLLMPTFNISGSHIEAVVTFDFSNFDSSKCLMRLYSFVCSVEMATGITFNASAEFDLIAPLTQPTVVLHGTRYVVNETANVSLAAINATCNTTRDRSSDINSIIAMRIENASGADILSFANVTSYNMFTNTCKEFVFIHWSEVFPYRSDLNGSNLTCYVETNSKQVSSDIVALTFLEQQNPFVSATANPAVTTSTNAKNTMTTNMPIVIP